MKILSVSHLFPNQVEPTAGLFVKARLNALSKVVDLKIIAPLPRIPFSSFIKKYRKINTIPEQEKCDGVDVYHPKYFLFPRYLKFMDGFFYYKSTNLFFSSMIELEKFDLMDFHWVYPDAFAGLKWAKRLNKKIVVTIRGNESICYYENSLRKRILINTLKTVDHIIAVSNDMKNKVVDEYGIENNKVTVIPNGIETKKFYRIDKLKARELCDLDMSKKYILSLSRLSHEKGLEYLIKAFSLLDEKDTELIIAGDGPLREKLSTMAKELKIDSKVQFVGSVPNEKAYIWYNAVDVFCLPSLWEGCPNVIIESLACGTPVVSTIVGGIPDLISADDYGFLVPAGDSIVLKKALKKALKKDWDYNCIGNYGGKNSWEDVANRITEVFEYVLEKK